MANNKFSVGIPSDPSEAIRLLTAIKTKHAALAATSPLAALKWAEIDPALTTAVGQDALSDHFHREAEKATGARDAKISVVTEAIRAARDVLMGLNRDNPDALGDFGFKVSDARAAKTSTPKPVA